MGTQLSIQETGFFKRLKEDLAVVYERDPAVRSTLEILLCYPGFHAMLFHRFANWLWRQGWRLVPRFLSHLARFLTGIEIHPGATIGRRFFIDHGMGVVIGETAIVGDDCTLYHGVTLGGTTWQRVKRHPTLGDRVLVSAGAKVLGNIEIGSDSRIGAGSVVVKDVPPNCTVVGIPGKIVMQDGKRVTSPLHKIALDHHNLPDPVQEVLQQYGDELHRLQTDVDELRRSLAQSHDESLSSQKS